jgi:hypothetical protein
MKPAIILLGAGAATPWNASTTDSITKSIIADNKFKTWKGNSLSAYIFEKLSFFYPNKLREINFETIISVLETLHSYFYSKGTRGASPKFIGSFSHWFIADEKVMTDIKHYDFKPHADSEFGTLYNLASEDTYSGVHKSRQESRYLYESIKYYLNLIRSKISHYCVASNDSQYLGINSKVKELIFYLKDHGYTPRFYTTNYDRLLPKIFSKDSDLKFFDGFNKPFKRDSFGVNYQIDLNTIFNLVYTAQYIGATIQIIWIPNINLYAVPKIVPIGRIIILVNMVIKESHYSFLILLLVSIKFNEYPLNH